jgi:sulfocyanin
MLLAALVACSPTSQSAAERRAEAARADSSAAGYDVGVKTPVSGPAVAAHVASTDSATDSTKHTGPRTVAVATAPASSVPVPPPVTRAPPPVDSTRPRTGRGGTARPSDPAPPAVAPLDPALESMFLTYDEAKKTATFQLAAGTEIEGQISFNGVRRGGRVLTVPTGWRVNVEFTNRDGDLPHSATIIASFEPIPEELPASAFPQAQTVKVSEGLLDGDSDNISFVADRAGRYMIACGVLGHAQRGQWLVLDVSSTATVPTYR